MTKTTVSILLLGLILVMGASAQTPPPTPPSPPEMPNFAAAGVSYSPGASPALAGTGLYARLIAGTGTYAFTAVDALPASLKPFTVTTQFSTGIAQRLLTIGKVPIFMPTSAGVSYTGTNTGWAWTTGVVAVIPVGPTWRVVPTARLLKSSVSQNAGYQVIAGVLFGWGW